MITAGWHYLHGDSKVDIGSVSNTVSIVSDSDGDEVNRYPTGLSWSSVLEAVTACIGVTGTQWYILVGIIYSYSSYIYVNSNSFNLK